ncbi:ribosomal protein L12E/L44/L45/RPP1/RPP2 [Paraburkholderia bannensis]|uniref:Ribosomal protein L12E/L44/L45/RPP1/RPP2 n=1 Tax=Paraburkholderia bannensis TaxID=765414 RepID=A0A7W9TV10_9BURK|nr:MULTISPECIES: hypothetical protein [Paraburkholderia]MBB3256841.1 ribosomal protein L12E/L44/L45/RPP1/RPP2 [Paraburkholderia sp. WP4_3_2]MBB6101839.1 ribosomal protein L12E/L44/L45/RPP1/RPP2 [Paraburkholderia bannensis]
MKKIIAAIAAGLAALAISGCAVPGSTSTTAVSPVVAAQQAAEKFQAAVTAACNVIQPTIQPFAIILNASPGFSTFNGDLTLACTINSTLDLTSINSIIDSSTTAAQTAVGGISSLNSTDQALIKAAIGAFQGSLKNALAQYKATVAAAAASAASTATAASAPVAASQ